jgi:hypothetical protein
LGQLKPLRKTLGALTRDVVEWMVDPVNWWHFCQQVCAESRLRRAPDHPHLGFLLAIGIGLRVMHSKLRNSTPTPDFVVLKFRLQDR